MIFLMIAQNHKQKPFLFKFCNFLLHFHFVFVSAEAISLFASGCSLSKLLQKGFHSIEYAQDLSRLADNEYHLRWLWANYVRTKRAGVSIP